MKKGLLLVILAIGVLLTSPGAWAADVGLSITGAPTAAKQGETKTFTINVSGTGNLNIINHPNPGTVTVNTVYTAGGSSGNADTSCQFSAPTTLPPCAEQGSSGECKPSQPISGGPYAITASVVIPTDLAVGFYTITVFASATNGLGLGAMPSFELQVEPGGSAPSVSIINPANGSTSFLVNQPVVAAVDIQSDLDLTSLTATLNGTGIALSLNSESGNYEGDMTLTQPGTNVFAVQACNSVGCGTATSTFTVHYSFGNWLPPITTSKFQHGRTLPVKFRIGDYNGLTAAAIATVTLDGVPQGTAYVYYDPAGPYYQLNIDLAVPVGPHAVGVSLNDGFTSAAYPISVK